MRNNEPDQNDLEQWADSHYMETVAVLQVSRSEHSDLSNHLEQDGYIPSFWVLGPDMSIIAEDSQYPSDPARYIE